MKNIGLIVNPVAGMGGTVGLKGTDGDFYFKALELGAIPVTPYRTHDFLSFIEHREDIKIFTPPGIMGENILKQTELKYIVTGQIAETTTSEDTVKIARLLLEKGMDLLVFVGGDGTARNIYDAIGLQIPVIGVPSGVKVFSSVFALSARAAGSMLDRFVEGSEIEEQEVLDIDEDAFRENRLSARLYGYLKVPRIKEFLQVGKKASTTGSSARENKDKVSRDLLEQMEKDTLYLLGPGTTMKSLTDRLGIPKTLLGIDAVVNKKLIQADVNEKDILELYEKYERRKIAVTPLGGNGFIFGRGSRQFTPRVISLTGKDNIILAGDMGKIGTLDCLHVDTGDLEVDRSLAGPAKVITGYHEKIILEVKY